MLDGKTIYGYADRNTAHRRARWHLYGSEIDCRDLLPVQSPNVSGTHE
jgi:hypothetical protein